MEMKINSERVKSLRQAHHMSQDELAGAAGLSLRTIQRIESEGIASLESKKALASVLNVTIESLHDSREAENRYLRWLVGGTSLGFLGVFVGGACAAFGIYSSYGAGELSAASAGTGFSLLGLAVGGACAAIGITFNCLRTRAA